MTLENCRRLYKHFTDTGKVEEAKQQKNLIESHYGATVDVAEKPEKSKK